MKLHSYDFAAFAKKIETLERSGIDAPSINVNGYRLTLETSDSQMDGASVVVTNIEPIGNWHDDQAPLGGVPRKSPSWGGDHPGNPAGTPYAEQ